MLTCFSVRGGGGNVGSRSASNAATPLSRTPSPGPRVVYAAPVREESREQEEPPVQQENAHMLRRNGVLLRQAPGRVRDADASPVRDLPHTSAYVSIRQRTSADADASPVGDENSQPNVVAPDGALEMRSPPFDACRKAFSCQHENALLQSPQPRHEEEEEEEEEKARKAKMEEEELARGIDEAFR